jgi:hypothetical protein
LPSPWSSLQDRPRIEALRRFVERLLAEYGDGVEFVVLYGSMARGDYDPWSDHDVLVGLTDDDGLSWPARIGLLQRYAPSGAIEPHPYTSREVARMLADCDGTMLDACRDGVVLHDRGAFARIRAAFESLRKVGFFEEWHNGWRVHPRAVGADDSAGHVPPVWAERAAALAG